MLIESFKYYVVKVKFVSLMTVTYFLDLICFDLTLNLNEFIIIGIKILRYSLFFKHYFKI